MRIKPLDVGVETVTLWQVDDEVHLPQEARVGPRFLPEYRALDSILNRPSLDERLPELLQPTALDPELLQPATLADTRAATQALMREAAGLPGQPPEARAAFAAAAELLSADTAMDAEVRGALAMLLRG
ncbi:hypothetical protein [Aureimonas jatrophae]|uniref:Uncharacterized protein n=1 Tax=Aureimonas jatrophae TaxID=1166073 RepID=A0A1H0ESX8_9HYPH|nr:hypothetical protein [Aureimonas jatrophae]MBB3950330.1 hypothetical protein [Aureimonas jatrophae]SDN85471.1 hypothetical protein SAMN05192530_102205 [Aureimonas jatrophae]